MSVSLQLKPTREHDFNLGARLGFQILSQRESLGLQSKSFIQNYCLPSWQKALPWRKDLQCLQCSNSFYPHIQGAWPTEADSSQTLSITSLLVLPGKTRRISRPWERLIVLLGTSPLLETQSRGGVCTLCDGHAEIRNTRAQEAGTGSLERHGRAGFFPSWKEQPKYPEKVQSWSAYRSAWKHWLGI